MSKTAISVVLATALMMANVAHSAAPAARVGDIVSGGGTIIGPGAPNVLISGMPAARLSDVAMCIAPPPPSGPGPHAGTIVIGSSTVLIGGLPAARVGDLVTCIGPPQVIVGPGATTVLIGP